MIDLKIDSSRLDTKERREKMLHVSKEMHQIMNSSIFRDEVLKIKKHGETSKWKDASNLEIYNHIMSGSEVLSPEPDKVLTWVIDDYYSIKRVIGYTYPNTTTIYVNTRYFDRNPTVLIGSNQLHELGHKLGFDHDFRATARRPYSICYQLNDVYENCYERIFGVSRVEKTICRRSWRSLWLRKRCYKVKVWDL